MNVNTAENLTTAEVISDYYKNIMSVATKTAVPSLEKALNRYINNVYKIDNNLSMLFKIKPRKIKLRKTHRFGGETNHSGEITIASGNRKPDITLLHELVHIAQLIKGGGRYFIPLTRWRVRDVEDKILSEIVSYVSDRYTSVLLGNALESDIELEAYAISLYANGYEGRHKVIPIIAFDVIDETKGSDCPARNVKPFDKNCWAIRSLRRR